MPLFDYTCRGCGTSFEAIVSSRRPAVCPTCAGDDLAQKLPIIAKPAVDLGFAPATSPCGVPCDPGGCGAGACGAGGCGFEA